MKDPIDLEHQVDRHDDDLDRLSKDVAELQKLRVAINDLAKAVKLLHEISQLHSSTTSAPGHEEFQRLLASATGATAPLKQPRKA